MPKQVKLRLWRVCKTKTYSFLIKLYKVMRYSLKQESHYFSGGSVKNPKHNKSTPKSSYRNLFICRYKTEQGLTFSFELPATEFTLILCNRCYYIYIYIYIYISKIDIIRKQFHNIHLYQ